MIINDDDDGDADFEAGSCFILLTPAFPVCVSLCLPLCCPHRVAACVVHVTRTVPLVRRRLVDDSR